MKLAVTELVDPDCPNFALAFYGRGKDYENKDDYDRAIVFPSLRRRFFIPRRLPGFFKTSSRRFSRMRVLILGVRGIVVDGPFGGFLLRLKLAYSEYLL